MAEFLPERRPPSVPAYEPREFALELVGIRPETPDISSFEFRPSGLAGRLRFHPGQALTLSLAVGDETAFRTFTIASSPTRPDTVTLTVKAAATGRITRWMHANLQPGIKISARGPVGQFSLAWHHAEKLLLVSAGSGATPMISMLRWLADRGEATDIAYLHVARTQADLLFRDEVARLAEALPNLRPTYAVTGAATSGWTGPSGRLTRAMLAELVPDATARETFCCGPAGFMDAVRAIYLEAGGEAARFHTETFGVLAPATPAPPRIVDGAPLTLAIGERQMPADANDTILATALANGIVIPTGCRNGICGTCRLLKLSGEVEMHHNGGLSAREIANGMILACCSRPRSDVAVEPPRR